ncbi:MAG: AAA family ATPase [Mogibacterium sp.]|nr:AAA family ATPase [Mogibacterium sp.]
MIIIKRIKIRNFRSIVDETIDLSDFNCFVGKNDSGKSNVLKALNLFFNGETDHGTVFDFDSDYSMLAKKSAKHAKEIKISIDIIIPDSYLEKGVKTWTKVWRRNGLHANNFDSLFSPGSKGFTLLKRITYLYIPAVKSREYFKDLLSSVYASMTKSANSALQELNDKYSTQLQSLTKGLSDQLLSVLNMESAIRMPPDLNTLFRDLSFSTSDKFVSGVDLNHRGDGIRARHIPSILRYMQKNTEENRPKNSVNGTYIWGFEEPENGVEYISCFEMADELYSYRSDCQLLITTHSPAFYAKRESDDATCYYVSKDDSGVSKYETRLSQESISERIGFLPLVAPYIQAERERYLLRQAKLKEQYDDISQKYREVTGKVIIITEGKTDAKHIKIAFEQLGLDQPLLSRLEYYDFSHDAVLGEQLRDLLIKLSNLPNTNPIIGIFDRDKHLEINQHGKNYKVLKNNVYRFNIPPLSNSERKTDDRICIEHYYSNSEIETPTDFGHLYLGRDFNEYGKSSDENWFFEGFSKNKAITPISIIDSSNKHISALNAEAKIISKDDFADYVVNHPEEFDFENFRLIFEVIRDIVIEFDAKIE